MDEQLRLLKIYEDTLAFIANHLTSDEGDRSETEEFFGLDFDEVICMAHDEMIMQARRALGRTDVKQIEIPS